MRLSHIMADEPEIGGRSVALATQAHNPTFARERAEEPLYIRSIIIRLVVDEALSVGDRKFAKKCRERVNSIIANENVTVLFVTHSTGTAKEFLPQGHRHPEGQSYVQRWHRGGRRLLHRLVTLQPFR